MTDIGSTSISIFKNSFLQADGGVCPFSREDVNCMPFFFPKDRKREWITMRNCGLCIIKNQLIPKLGPKVTVLNRHRGAGATASSNPIVYAMKLQKA